MSQINTVDSVPRLLAQDQGKGGNLLNIITY
jgi:hypothetical protein